MKTAIQWFISVLAVVVMLKISYSSGLKDGQRGLGYWEGWHDAMTQTQYGTKPFNSETNLK